MLSDESTVIQESYKCLWSAKGKPTSTQIKSDAFDFGYLITIPYYAGEKRTISDIINLFAKEAFDENLKPFLSKKIALVIGVNQKDSNDIIDISTKLPASDIEYPFDIAVISFLWSHEQVPHGDICNFINVSKESQKLVKKLREDGCKVIYYAKFDADTVALNQCFSNYEARIKHHYKTTNVLPHIITSGYITQHIDKAPSEHYLELGTKTDYVARRSVAHHLPFSPYFTEANALILLPPNDDFLQEQYSQTCEMAGMIRNIHKRRHLDPYKHFLFVEDSPIVTEYRPSLIKELEFQGTFEDGHYVGWNSKDIKKLRKIWQTHYRDDQKFYGYLQDNLKLIFEYEYANHAYGWLGHCIEFVVQHINRCFDPLIIAQQTLPTYIRSELGKKSVVVRTEAEYIMALTNVLLNYDSYVGWRKPLDETPSPYVLERESSGVTLHLDEPPKDFRLTDLGDLLWLKKLEEKLLWLLVMYAVKAKYPEQDTLCFFDQFEYPESSYIKYLRKTDINSYEIFLKSLNYTQLPDGTITIKEKRAKTFEAALKIVSNKYGTTFSEELNQKITTFVRLTIAAAHEKGIAVTALFSKNLLLDYLKHIPSLLKQMINANRKSHDTKIQSSWTQLHYAIFNGNPIDLSEHTLAAVGEYGCNALHLLAISERPDDLKDALTYIGNHCSDVNRLALLEAETENGKTPLELAFDFGKTKEVALFIDAGANFSLGKRRRLLFDRTLENESLLHIVAAFGSSESLENVISQIQSRKSEPENPRDLINYVGETPLHRFISEVNVNIKSLKSLMTPHNFDLEDDDDFTPLLLASSWSEPDMRKVQMVLIDAGADCTIEGTHTENSPLEQAIEDGDEELVRLMLKRGPNLTESEWILHNTICEPGDYSMVRLLLNHLSQKQLHKIINKKDHQGNAPIHLVIMSHRNKLLDLLIEYGADPCLKNKAELTPIGLARKHKNNEAIFKLTDILCKKSDYEMAFSAFGQGSNTAKLLRSKGFFTETPLIFTNQKKNPISQTNTTEKKRFSIYFN